ncbi:MAG: hypothetical protein CMD16_01290 [Flavobacteriales bacterium]|nr:hypothetical protein [Flavobacteriales bacterium]|tara:strand:- start:49279 stop:49941 length:663 start_codon:yes stop_codon:yes gene_type:complete
MKNILYILLAFSIIITACKKEEEEENMNPNPTVTNGCMDTIATNYNYNATIDDGSCTFGIVGGAWITDSEVLEMHATASMGSFILLDTLFTETETNPDSMEHAIQKFLQNGDVKFWDNNNNLIDSGTWVQSGTTVTITTDTVIIGEILSVNKTNLVHEVTGNQNFSENGVDYNIDFTFTGNHTRNENGFTTNNTNQRIGNTNHTRFLKPKMNNLFKNLKK